MNDNVLGWTTTNGDPAAQHKHGCNNNLDESCETCKFPECQECQNCSGCEEPIRLEDAEDSFAVGYNVPA